MNGPSDRELARWVRETLLFDAEDEPRDEAKAQRMLAEIYRRSAADDDRRRRRRRRRIFGAAGAGLLIAGGATVAALTLRGGQPSVPEGGIGCHSEATLESDVVVVAPGQEPVAACRQVWESGEFAELLGAGQVLELVVCVDPVGGAINVFPGEAGLCAELGLEPADPELDAESQAVLDLRARLGEEINALDCQPATAVAEQVEAILAESGLADWQVVFAADPETNACAKAGLDSATRSISIIEIAGGDTTP